MDSGAGGRGRGRASNADAPAASQGTTESLLTKRKLDSLTGQIQQQVAGGPNASGRVDHITLSPEVAEVLCELASDFVENAAAFGCRLAKHRKSKTLEVRDLQAYLDRHWNINIPGFGTSDERLQKNKPTEAHRQKVVSVRKDIATAEKANATATQP